MRLNLDPNLREVKESRVFIVLVLCGWEQISHRKLKISISHANVKFIREPDSVIIDGIMNHSDKE